MRVLIIALVIVATVVGTLIYIFLLFPHANVGNPSSPTPTSSPPTPTLIPTPPSSPIPTEKPSPTINPTAQPTPIPTPSPNPSPTPPLAPTTVRNSTNWAGFAIASDLQNPQPNVFKVSASWVVPAVVPSSSDTFSAIWIGVGGEFPNDTTLIQCGTEHDSSGSLTTYFAWYEMLPRTSVPIRMFNVSPGDQMQASIQLVDVSSSQWLISISDMTSQSSFQNNFTYGASQLSAEWVVERPLINRVLSTLANFGEMSFTNCSVTVGTVSGGINSFPNEKILMFSSPMANTAVQAADVSNLSGDGSQFTVTYLSTQ